MDNSAEIRMMNFISGFRTYGLEAIRGKNGNLQKFASQDRVTMRFRVYPAVLIVNGAIFNEVWIDPHYEIAHPEINDELILKLAQRLQIGLYEPELMREDGYSFFVSDVWFEDKPYRLVWVTPPDQSYLGIRTAFRRSK